MDNNHNDETNVCGINDIKYGKNVYHTIVLILRFSFNESIQKDVIK